MQACQQFNGTITLDDTLCQYQLKIETVNNNQFTFTEVCSLDGQVLETNSGQGNFTQDGQSLNLQFEDNGTVFRGVYNTSNGSLVGTNTQKNGSSSGNFSLQLA